MAKEPSKVIKDLISPVCKQLSVVPTVSKQQFKIRRLKLRKTIEKEALTEIRNLSSALTEGSDSVIGLIWVPTPGI